MNNFKQIEIKSVYRTGSSDLLRDFYLPTLKCCKYYDRAVGYFSTSLLTYALKGVSSIVQSDGQIRLVVGYPLSEEEFEALQEGEDSRALSSALIKELGKIIDEASTSIERSRLRLFTLLVATNKLKLKFAFKKRGMYHEKIGIMKDHEGNKILFTGSANETTNAINPELNFESISVYKSWEASDYKKYASEFENGFEDLWSGSDPKIITIEMPSEMYEIISKSYRDNSRRISDEDVDELELINHLSNIKNNNYPIIPKAINGNKFKIYKHQLDALKNWFISGSKGLFRLATGSGKTITSMYAISAMFEKDARPRKMLVIIAVPYQALADQWVKELSLFNMKPVKCYISTSLWEGKLRDKINLLNNGSIEFLSVVVVNRTLMSEKFKSIVSKVSEDNTFFIGDECHHHGNEKALKYLPRASIRMGLSATPFIDDHDWEFDDEPNSQKDVLTEFYGSVVGEYKLSDALIDGILTPYIYNIVVVGLTSTEVDNYLEYSKEIARQMARDKSKDNVALANAVRKRNKIINNAELKKTKLDSLLQNEKFDSKSHSLVYVGEGSSNIDEDSSFQHERETTQLEEISKVLVRNGWKPSKFTSLESRSERKNLMNGFVEGSIDALVSMRVLDEGIDIPQCKRAFILASSRNSRQFIQRRGRILRRAKGKEVAEIFDFIVVPDEVYSNHSPFKKLVYMELKRVMDFVRLAKNRDDCEETARNIARIYDIDTREV